MAAETSQSESPEVGKEAQLGLIYAKALLGRDRTQWRLGNRGRRAD